MAKSAVVGKCWTIPLLDSNLVLDGEKTAKCLLPTGETVQMPFYSGTPPANAKYLYACPQPDLKTMAVVCPDGTKLIYQQGRLTSILYRSTDHLKIDRSNENWNIAINNEPIASYSRSADRPMATLRFRRHHYEISLAEKVPILATVGGAQIITGFESAISGVKCDEKDAFKCEVVSSSEDPNSFVYEITSRGKALRMPLLQTAGTVPAAPTAKRDATFAIFDNGPLSGRVRSVELQVNGAPREMRMSYDEKATLIRAQGEGVSLKRINGGYELREQDPSGGEKITHYTLTQDGFLNITNP